MTEAVKVVHHGAAATSSNKVLTWLPPSSQDHDDTRPSLVYASHAMINIARPVAVQLYPPTATPADIMAATSVVWNVQETLRTNHSYSTGPTESAPTLTTLTRLRPMGTTTAEDTVTVVPTLAGGFSNGSITVWNKEAHNNNNNNNNNNNRWKEHAVVDAIAMKQQQQVPDSELPRSWTDLKGIVWKQSLVLLAACSSAGVSCYSYDPQTNMDTTHTLLTPHTACALQWEALSDSTLLLLIGTAAPRYNKILVYTVTLQQHQQKLPLFHYGGALTGHEDWVTCFAWQSLLDSSSANNNDGYMLASGSQDFKIRLWKFTTTTAAVEDALVVKDLAPDTNPVVVDSDDEDDKEEDDYEEHESRMEILWKSDSSSSMQTSVSLEALLLGHEGPVTAIQWYHDNPNSNDTNSGDQPLVLLSSSMDRSILLWAASEEDGIWTPISRVGSAGGILGGSIGSTLLGYVNVQTMPANGVDNSQWLVGHAYGGALHMWQKEGNDNDSAAIEHHHWKATPCVTGHFDGVTDLCWESTYGSYLLTVSGDQTCRLWAPVDTVPEDNTKALASVWAEVARPQVHGYNLSAVTSLSSPKHRHWMVSGADEKELRILDAPMTTLRMLQAIQPQQKAESLHNKENNIDGDTHRVERAYIPSLGLSNKATAADGAEEDVQDAEDGVLQQRKAILDLPSERDLGALSLWLETRKLFGHNTELFCVTSTLEANTAFQNDSDECPILVASTAKARDVEAAGIRIWNPNSGECLQTLAGGHKSTVATLSFSPAGGKYLASSGKDRRLCLWKHRNPLSGDDQPHYTLAAAKDTAHKRIIWSVHFCPYDSSILASGSRDGNIKIWKVADAEDGLSVSMEQLFSFAPATLSPAKKPDAVTALAFAPQTLPHSKSAVLALGFECGLIELWSIPIADGDTSEPKLVQCFAPNLCHVATVTKLAWRPLRSNNCETLVLASASADRGCRIFDVALASL